MTTVLAPSPAARQFIKFAVVGCVNVVASFVVFILFYRHWPLGTLLLDGTGSFGTRIGSALGRIGVHTIDAGVANTAGYLAGMANSFILNKRWTFEAKGQTALQVRRFVILNVFAMACGTLVIFVFVDLLGAPYLPVWIIVTGLVMVVNFLGNKYWTFVDSSALVEDGGRASADGSL
jgi:putative flippase GtrA